MLKSFTPLKLVLVLAVLLIFNLAVLLSLVVSVWSVEEYEDVTNKASTEALTQLADSMVKAGNGQAQADSSNPGRGVYISDIPVSMYTDAVLENDAITVFGKTDQCVVISVFGSNSDAVFVVSDVKVSSDVTAVDGIVTGGQCN